MAASRPNYAAHASVMHTIATGHPDLRNATIDHCSGEAVRAIDHLHHLAVKHDRVPAEHKKHASAVTEARTIELKRAALKKHHKVTRAVCGGYLSGLHRAMQTDAQTGAGFFGSLWHGIEDVGKMVAKPLINTVVPMAVKAIAL